MQVAGIIAEYNPLHNGHAFLIEKTKEAGATHIITVISGNFTQRGEPALLPKSDRVKMALAAGADLVIELPLPWAVSSAQWFAHGGVSLLHKMGCVDTLSFGSECGDVDAILSVVKAMQNPVFQTKLQSALSQGVSYAQAKQKALETVTNSTFATILDTPNNTLAIEYCKALLHLQSNITPFTITRQGVSHDSELTDGCFASAKKIRNLVQNGQTEKVFDLMPYPCADILQDAILKEHCITDPTFFERVLLSHLRTLSKEQIAELSGISEGLENRLYNAIRQKNSIQEILQSVKTKRYPLTRLQRILIAALLQLPANIEKQTPPYIRILGIGKNGAEVLKKIEKSATLPLFSDPKQPPKDDFSRQIFNLECKASDLYGSFLSTPTPCGQEFTVGMIR